MLSTTKTLCFQGLNTVDILVQAQVASGLPAFVLVGLPDKAVAESRERVRAALYSLGLSLPPKRIVINLSPADLQKEGSHYDLPIALALMTNLDILPKDALETYLTLGELGLDGSLLGTGGTLVAGVHAKEKGYGLICPQSCAQEAAWAGDLNILAPQNLLEIVNHFKGVAPLSPPKILPQVPKRDVQMDFEEIKGQGAAKRALEIAAAGGHNILMVGPPGAGKSMLAERFPSICPPLNAEEALHVSMIHSAGGKLKKEGLIRQRPFRNPHHSASMSALVGGGIKAFPGEVSLAHNGVLFLDELPEFQSQVLEALRQPLESGEAVIARANHRITYPACFQLIAAMNPCRCGYLHDAHKKCARAPACGIQYQKRISGPLLDRIDLQVYIPLTNFAELQNPIKGENSAAVRERVNRARNVQAARQGEGKRTFGTLNARLKGQNLDRYAPLTEPLQLFLQQIAEQRGFSVRQYHKVIRVARTIADLTGSEEIKMPHLAESVSYQGASSPMVLEGAAH
jgi:magnesium chelatase family protein